jgi:protein-disulfide isomerase
MPKIKKEYIDTGKLRYVFRDFPLNFHKNALNAAMAASCSGDQGKYWEMHDLIFANQKAMDVDNLMGHAESLGLDMGEFKKCFEGNKYAEEAKKDMADGQAAGVKGTPSFFVGITKPGSKEFKGKFIRGAQPYAAFKKVFDELLTEEAAAK